VKCGLKYYQGDQMCECPKRLANGPTLPSVDSNLAHFMEQLSIHQAAQQQQAELAAAEGYAQACAPQAGYAVAQLPAQQHAVPTAPEGYAYLPPQGYAVSHPPAAGPSMAAAAAGHYTPNAYGLATNTADGYVDLERRAVHLANLSRKTRVKDIRQLVARKKIGRVLSVDLHTDASERCKGSAVVHFATADEANYAVGMLNDYEWVGERRIRARLAKEAAVVSEAVPMPVIVNGTTHSGQ